MQETAFTKTNSEGQNVTIVCLEFDGTCKLKVKPAMELT